MSASRTAGTLPTMRHARTLLTIIGPLALAACAATPPGPGTPAASPTSTAVTSASATEPTPTAAASSGGGGWHEVDVDGDAPAAREDHTLTVSPDGATAYLFGGRTRDGDAFDDLWALDLATDSWSRVRASGPPARFGHNAAWAVGIGLVIFAGQSQVAFYNDLWAFDPAAEQWTQLPARGDLPVPRYGSCAGVGPDGRFWISHGFTSEGSRFADTRAYDFATDTWTDETPAGDRPIERCLHGCWWTHDGSLALYAGQTTGVPALGDLWRLTQGPRPGTNAWSMVDRQQRWPVDRQLYAFVHGADTTVIFGGRASDGRYLDDAWLLPDDGAPSRIRVADAPAARAGAELIADPRRGRIVLFGGRDADGAFNDLWELTLPAGSR